MLRHPRHRLRDPVAERADAVPADRVLDNQGEVSRLGAADRHALIEERYSVLATVSKEGVVLTPNTLLDVKFSFIFDYFDHAETRIVIVSIAGLGGVYVIDLWSSYLGSLAVPVPAFLSPQGECKFVHTDLASGWCVLNINNLDH